MVDQIDQVRMVEGFEDIDLGGECLDVGSECMSGLENLEGVVSLCVGIEDKLDPKLE